MRRAFALVGFVGIAAGLVAATLSAASGIAAPGSVSTPPPISYPTPRYYPTTGPYISEAKALAIAASIANGGSVGRQEARLMKYGDVSKFLGSVNRYYDPGRDMYFVVTSGQWQSRGGASRAGVVSCLSYIAVIDASDGTVLEAGCNEPHLTWPTVLPAGFGR